MINWPLEELEAFFISADLPEGSIKLSSYETITDPPGFILASLEALKANRGNSSYLPYLDRLIKLKNLLS